jgi:nucleoside recognition membrane protein YjiH
MASIDMICIFSFCVLFSKKLKRTNYVDVLMLVYDDVIISSIIIIIHTIITRYIICGVDESLFVIRP